MQDEIEVTELGKRWAQENATDMRRELKALIDGLDPETLLKLWAELMERQRQQVCARFLRSRR